MKSRATDSPSPLLDSLPGLAYRCLDDERGTLLELSSGCLELTGTPAEQLLQGGGAALADLVHPEDWARVRQEMAEGLRRSGRYELEYRIFTARGRVRWVWDWGRRIDTPPGEPPQLAGFVSDSSPVFQRQGRLIMFQHAVINLSRHPAVGTGNVEEVMNLVTETASELVDTRLACVWLLGDDGQTLRPAVVYDRESGRHHPDITLSARDFPRYFEALASGRAIVAGDARHDPRTREFTETFFEPNGVGAVLDAVVLVGGHPVGTVTVEHAGGPRAWRVDEISFMGELADQLAQAIAHQRHLEDARRAAEAESQMRARDDFLATMSHELRTPMNGILGMAELLLAEDQLGDAQRKRVLAILNSGESLLSVLNDVLDFSKINARKLDIEHIEFELDALVEGAVELFRARAEERRLALYTFLPPELPARAVGDPNRIRQVLNNLLSNALKFTGSGHVALSVRCDDGLWLFEVEDSGPGISPEAQERLFTPFTQQDASIARRFGGTGLGLAISQRLALLMGGVLTLHRTGPGGSTFRLSLPIAGEPGPPPAPDPRLAGRALGLRLQDSLALRQCAQMAQRAGMRVNPAGAAPELWLLDQVGQDTGGAPALYWHGSPVPPAQQLPFAPTAGSLRQAALDALGAAPAAPAPAAPQRPPLEGLRVLVAEDNEVNQAVVIGMLRRLGALSAVCDNGRTALDTLLSGERFDAVLMDCEMPEMSGYEACEALRLWEQQTGSAHTPVLALTAHALPAMREQATASGMDAYLTKPVKLEQLEAALAPLLQARPVA